MMSRFQKLVKLAFDRWEQSDQLYHDFLATCTSDEQAAVLISNLDTQVVAGGFEQWIDNGYCLEIPALKESLTSLGLPLSSKVIEIIEEIEPHVDFSAEYNGPVGTYLTKSGEGLDLDRLTELYGELSVDFLPQVEDYFDSLVAT